MEEEITFDLKDIFYVLVKRIKLIIIITVLSTLTAGILSFFVIPPTYEASTSIVVGKTGNDAQDKSGLNNNDVIMYQKLIKTYAKIAQSRAVAEVVSNKLGIDIKDFNDNLSVAPQNDTQIIEIKFTGKDKEQVFKAVNEASKAFISESKRIYPTGDIQVMDKANMPEKPVKPNKTLNVAIAFILGLMVSIGIAFVLEYMDNTIKTESDVEKYLELPVIGIIPVRGESK